MRVELNGEACELGDTATVEDAVRAAGGDPEGHGYAVAVGGEVVPRGQWSRRLRDGEKVEVLAAIQGGAPTNWFAVAGSRGSKR
jgi:sulfur carrier protein